MQEGIYLRPLLDLLFPSVCAFCGASVLGDRCLCDSCMEKVRYPHSPLCIRCGTVFRSGEDHLCGPCLRQPQPFTIARSVALYFPPVDILLHRLKFRADKTVLSTLSAMCFSFDFSLFSCCDLILPVPLHPRRLQSRGMNQSLVLAHVLFPAESGKIRPDCLLRTRNTPPQTGLGGRERRKNLRDAFMVPRTAGIRGLSICLVDDIFTTGTTVKECAGILMQAGAAEVRVLTMARVAGSGSW